MPYDSGSVRSPGLALTPDLPVSASPAADWWELLKPGISAFVVMAAAAGYVLGLSGPVVWWALAGLLLGTGLTAGGAGALNHVIERSRDRQMKRTKQRPVASGRIGVGAATVYGSALLAAGVALLAAANGPVVAGLAAATAASYLLIYTPLKRRTTLNTLVGTVPGALPALGGYLAASGVLDATGWAVFGILVLWQIPHFFSLAWLYRDDYARGGFAMLPVKSPSGQSTAVAAVAAALGLVLVGVLPTAFGTTGLVFGLGMAGLGTAFALVAFSFLARRDTRHARRLLMASILYLPAFLALVVVDAGARWLGVL